MQGPKIVEKPAFRLMGIAARTSNAAETDPATARIGKLWERFSAESLPGHIPYQTEPGVIYGLYADYENGTDGDYTVMAGCAVRPGSTPPGTLTVTDVPAARYAVFTSERGPMPDIVVDSWSKIWAMTPGELGGERAYTGDFEVYDDRTANTRNAQIDIWIALKP